MGHSSRNGLDLSFACIRPQGCAYLLAMAIIVCACICPSCSGAMLKCRFIGACLTFNGSSAMVHQECMLDIQANGLCGVLFLLQCWSF